MNQFKLGELLVLKGHVGSANLWADNFEDVVDHLIPEEFVTVTRPDDSYGWVYVLTPRGKVGIIHYKNLVRPVQSCSGTV